MAKIKQTVMQRNFTYMEIREDFLEGDDLDIRRGGLKGALNMKGLATRAIEARPGTIYRRTVSDVENILEISPESGLKFALIIRTESLRILDEDANSVAYFDTVPWTAEGGKVWCSTFREKTILGNGTEGIWQLLYNNGNWSLDDFEFAPAVGGELAQPYWVYEPDITIQPSAETGNVIVTANADIWTDDDIGQRIRYGEREIEITGRINKKKVEGTVISAIPPSYRITVQDGSVFRVGEAIIGADTNYQGLIVDIIGSNLYVVTTTFFEGPDVGEEISGPAGSSASTAKVSVAPLPSPLWDEPLMSPKRGFPRAAGQVAGRLVLLDFPQEPDLIILSSTRKIEDFDTGAEDDDAIVRQVGDGAPRWLHAVNMGDLILFSESGIYNVPARENGVISPSTFNPVLVDETGASTVEPVKVEDGIVFVEASGENVSSVLLDGNVYLKWSVKKMTTFHNHLIKSPTHLCGPSLGSRSAEKYLFVVNSDGTAAAVSWQQSIRDEAVGFAPWETNGMFLNIAPLFDSYWAIVRRNVGGQNKEFLEEFSDDAYLDSAVLSEDTTDEQYLTGNGEFITANGGNIVVVDATASHLVGEEVTYYANGWDVGDFTVAGDGSVDPGNPVPGEYQIGFNFEAEVSPWPVEVIESPRIGTLTARVLQVVVSAQNTLGYEITCNSNTRTIDAYRFGDDLSEPPAPRTEVRHFPIYGNRDHPHIMVAKRRPGPFRILALGQRVQA